ncbi:MAG TPA: plastocyanin/azurin family copper-binding protein [Gaiellaceae bacterium]|nr:plastocyanin/azurin family copper-binding protein [Gaiellaceae bacterium]
MKRWIYAITLVLTFALVAGGCGGDNGEAEPEQPPTETGPGEETTLQLAADPGGALAFDRTTLEAPTGTITIELANESSLAHNVAVEGQGVYEESPIVTGEPTSLTVELAPGSYTFLCSVPGHQEGGMEGTLTVG